MVSDDHRIPESTNDTNQRHARDGGGTRGFWNRWMRDSICGWFSLVGVILLVGFTGALIGEINLRMDCTEITDGTVAQMIRVEDEDSVTWKPVFRYDVDGRIYEQESSVSSSPPRYKVGQAIIIRYDPADPNRYVADGDYISLIALGAVVIMCLGFTAVLPVAMIISKRRQSNET